MKRPHDLTDQQLALLGVLWERGEATAHEVHQALLQPLGLARGTIGTMLHRLERQGVIGHRADGREFLYSARVNREDVTTARIRGLVEGLFDGDVAAMVRFAVTTSSVTKGDLERLRRLLDAHARKDPRR